MTRPAKPVKPLTPARRAVAECNLKLAVHIADRFAKTYGLDPFEVRSVSYECLTRAASTFDHRRGKLGSYFGFKISRGIIEWLRAKRESEEHLHFIPLDWEWRDPPSPDDRISAIDDGEEASFLIRFADSRCRELLRLVCFEGMTQDEAGKSIGMSKARVTQLLKLASEEIRFFSRYEPEH